MRLQWSVPIADLYGAGHAMDAYLGELIKVQHLQTRCTGTQHSIVQVISSLFHSSYN